MGVPSLFRWLSRKYPKIISPVLEDDPEPIGGIEQPVDYAAPNPNGELDNLYLDMNGIVHPCSHPENKPPPENEAEMMLAVFEYTERVLNMARPRKLLMIAVDGVAPRAKMNQQRSRRFRSARDAKIADEAKARELDEMEAHGQKIDEAVKNKKTWDSNAITPGTPFMDILAESLRYWVAYKLATDPGWASLQVIISDASVPGEGEHKLMNFIRSQRSDPEWNPNTTHCIYGLDADLIFLSLATHEPHFRVLREDVYAKDQFQKKMRAADQVHLDDNTKSQIERTERKKPFIWLHIGILREYLEVELSATRRNFEFNLERAIDDWVFLCFFCGNDFLPHLPCLDVRDSSIDTLVTIWKRIMPQMKGYMTCDGSLDLGGVEMLLTELGMMEDNIFRRRHEGDQRRIDNNKRRKMERQQQQVSHNKLLKTVSNGKDNAPLMPTQNMTLTSLTSGATAGGLQMTNSEIVNNISAISQANTANKSVAEILKQQMAQESSETSSQALSSVDDIDVAEPENKRPAEVAFDEDLAPDALIDNNDEAIRMWEVGYQDRYYETKFHTTDPEELKRIKRDMVCCYVEGISWVLLYYYQGCPSWNWYYPYHYAPFAADFVDLKEITVEFDEGTPFRPFEQLMSVLPAASQVNLPEVFRPLMCEPASEIIDFYPEHFRIDMNGAKMAWQGISMLPFIDEKRLLRAVRAKYDQLTEAEVDRNTLKHEILLVGRKNKHFAKFQQLYQNQGVLKFHGHRTGLAGTASVSPEYNSEDSKPFPLEGADPGDYGDVPCSSYALVRYAMPPKVLGKAMILNGYISHLRILTEQDKQQTRNPHQRFPRGRFEVTNEIDYSQYVGKHGNSQYGPHRGGYKAFLEVYRYDSDKYQQTQQFNRYNSQQRDFQRQGYQNGGYQNGGRGYQNQGYQGNGGYQGNNGYGQSRGGYQSRGGAGGRGNYQGGYGRNHGGYQGGNQNQSQGYQSQNYQGNNRYQDRRY